MKHTKSKNHRASQLGHHFTSDYVDYDVASKKGNELLWGDHPVLGFYIIFSINSGLRVSDVRARRHCELLHLKEGDSLRVVEMKTKKERKIRMNKKVIDAYQCLISKRKVHNPEDFIFKSQKGTVYATESLNALLKEIFKGHTEHISTHSLRKSFGRHVYEINGRSEDALVKLSQMFRHSSLNITRIYLGITEQELGDIYMSL